MSRKYGVFFCAQVIGNEYSLFDNKEQEKRESNALESAEWSEMLPQRFLPAMYASCGGVSVYRQASRSAFISLAKVQLGLHLVFFHAIPMGIRGRGRAQFV